MGRLSVVDRRRAGTHQSVWTKASPLVIKEKKIIRISGASQGRMSIDSVMVSKNHGQI